MVVLLIKFCVVVYLINNVFMFELLFFGILNLLVRVNEIFVFDECVGFLLLIGVVLFIIIIILS